jgi:hypothetical protein
MRYNEHMTGGNDYVLTLARAEPVSAALRPGPLVRPDSVRLITVRYRGERLRRGREPWLEMRFSGAAAERADSRELLRQFAALTFDSSQGDFGFGCKPENIRAFAARFGALGLCREHGEPLAHRFSLGGKRAGLCPLDYVQHADCAVVREPIDGWIRWSRAARAILNLIANPGNQDELLALRLATLGDVADVVQAVNIWLSLCFFEVRVEPGPPPRLGNFTSVIPLFGRLGLQLALELGRTGGLAICAACGEPCDVRVRPREGRLAWCRKPECRRAMYREAQRRHRAGLAKPRRVRNNASGETNNGQETQG